LVYNFSHVDTQVKERLTGAVILVALVVLLVPELLSGPTHSAPTAQQRMDEPPMRSYTIDLADGGAKQSIAPQPEALAAKLIPRPVEEPLPVAPTPAPAETPPQTESEPAPAAIVAAPPLAKGFSVQLGSFASRDNAQRLVKELKSQGFAAFMLDRGKGKLYRVRVGPAADRAQAAALAAKLRAIGQPGSIVPYP